MSDRLRHSRMVTGALMAIAMAFGYASASYAVSAYVVSQKGRQFTPKEIVMKRGEFITIINDDGDLRHHAYIAADSFTFDSGDQEPGSKAEVKFPVAGTFEVLCAIHPKMKLIVKVQ